MSNKTEKTTIDHIEALLSDPNFRKASSYDRFQNIFHVLELNEVYHNRLIAWLLDSHQGHGFGTRVLREFLKSAIQHADDFSEQKGVSKKGFWSEWRLSDMDAHSLEDTMVFTEHSFEEGDGRTLRSDILLMNPGQQFTLAIEVKTGARFGDNQLEMYERWAASEDGHNRGVIVLDYNEMLMTGETGQITEPGYFSPMGFSPLTELLKQIIDEKPELNVTDSVIRQWINHMEDTDKSYPEVAENLVPLRTNLKASHQEPIDEINKAMNSHSTYDLARNRSRELKKEGTYGDDALRLAYFAYRYQHTMEMLTSSKVFEGVIEKFRQIPKSAAEAYTSDLAISPKALESFCKPLGGSAWINFRLDKIELDGKKRTTRPETANNPGPGRLQLHLELPEGLLSGDFKRDEWKKVLEKLKNREKPKDPLSATETHWFHITRWTGREGEDFPAWVETQVKKLTQLLH
ncbi:hypothetical protein J2T60_001627 [Natronospira proteinivora]|uniref:PD-(D/E)XK nuclease superfamily protein n=1 Tax=Natronospira proteinivora TaxID=1807133 RepID=A0ABT1GCG2_9GAMM|nr:PD-(D/E)XK nuclease family protein [Natronospira proteinivora]MCP1727627.1 hypothetical protein [Natronospira proteinivora]